MARQDWGDKRLRYGYRWPLWQVGVYAIVIETPGSEPGIFWTCHPNSALFNFNVVWPRDPAEIWESNANPDATLTYDRYDPRTQPLLQFQLDECENAPRSVRSTDWAENPQVACNRFEATVVMKLHIERTNYDTFHPTCPAGSVEMMLALPILRLRTALRFSKCLDTRVFGRGPTVNWVPWQ